MRFIKNIMSRKPAPEELNGSIEFEMDVEPLRRERPRAEADDSGMVNATAQSQEEKLAEAKRLFGLEQDDQDGADLPDPAPSSDAPDPAPEMAADDWDDDAWDNDEDWGDDWDEDAPAAEAASQPVADFDDDFDDDEEDEMEVRALQEKAHLVEEIREAMGAVSHITPEEKRREAAPDHRVETGKNWAEDEEFGRKAIARKELGLNADHAEERLLEEANWKLGDDESSRRRSAMAHLKAAAQATKADRVLSNVVGRDPASDPEEQSPYRADLAKVVRPRPTSRPAGGRSRPSPMAAPGAQEEDKSAWMGGDLTPEFPSEPSQTADDIAAQAAALENFSASRAGEDETSPDEPARTRIWDLGEDDTDIAPSADGEAEVQSADMDDAAGDETQAQDIDAPRAAAPLPTPDDLPAFDLAKQSEPAAEEFKVPAPATGRAGRSAGRVKTRLLGFQAGDQTKDVFAAATEVAEAPEKADPAAPAMFPVGWMVVTDGPGRGASFTLFTGVSQIGRGEDQAIRLDFGDNAISRQNHAAVAFDHEQKKFFLGHGGKSNLVRLNDRPVLSTEELTDADKIRIGETTLRFVALCDDDFGWDANEGDGADHAILA